MKSQNENSSTDQKKTNNKRYAFAQRQGDDFSCIKIMDGQSLLMELIMMVQSYQIKRIMQGWNNLFGIGHRALPCAV